MCLISASSAFTSSVLELPEIQPEHTTSPQSLTRCYDAAASPLVRFARQQTTQRAGLDRVDRQGPAADPPAQIGQFVLIVVAQMPDHFDQPLGAVIAASRDVS